MDATSSAMKALDIQKEIIQLQEQCKPPTEKDSQNNNAAKDAKLEKIESFKKAFETIKICFHNEPRDKALTLICALYNKLNCNNTILEFNEMFVNYEENEHWIPKKFEGLMKKKRTRNFLQQAFEKKNFNIITKTTEQCLEIKTIANSARILFTILIQCEWVQIEVLCIWAIIMTQEVNQADIETSTILNNNYALDVFFNHGVVALKSDQDQQVDNSILPLMDDDIYHQIKESTNNQQIHQLRIPIQIPINREEDKTKEREEIQEILHSDILIRKNEQLNKRSIEEVLKDVVHDFSSDDSDSNEEPQKKVIKKKEQADNNYDNDSTLSESFERIHDKKFIVENQEGRKVSILLLTKTKILVKIITMRITKWKKTRQSFHLHQPTLQLTIFQTGQKEEIQPMTSQRTSYSPQIIKTILYNFILLKTLLLTHMVPKQ